MKDRVEGAQVPTEKQVQVLIDDVAAIQKRIEAFTTSLTNAQRLATTKMRTGGESIVATLAKLAEQGGIVLPEVTGAGMTASLTLAQRLRPLADASRQLVRRLDDTIANAQSECWWSATALYTALSRVAAASPELQMALQPVVTFFAVGKRKKAPPKSSAPPTQSSPPNQSAA